MKNTGPAICIPLYLLGGSTQTSNAAADGQATALLAKDKDAGQPLATLQQDDWSDFIVDHFALEGGETEGAFRLKLTELDLDGPKMRLYMSQNLPGTGYCQPPELDDPLWSAVGPPTEYTAYKYLFWDWIDVQAMMDIYQQHTDWNHDEGRSQ